MTQSLGTYFLLLFAILVGWLLGRMSVKKSESSKRDTKEIFSDYFVGLNYLLNNEPDEAIDTFIKSLEINSDTAETHLALGALLRRRGKVDKAITIHQMLVSRSGLDKAFSESVSLQLALDYIAAGLLDRAESLLVQILDSGSVVKWDALRHLITIYQTEKDWLKAIESSTLLLKNKNYKRDNDIRGAAAHFCCELTELFLDNDENIKAKEQLKKAFSFDSKSIRASLLLARIEQNLGNFKAAIKELVRIRNNHPEFTSQVLGPLAECYEEISDITEYEQLLTNSLSKGPDTEAVLVLSELVRKNSGDGAAINFLSEYLTKKPSLIGLLELLRLQIPRVDSAVSSNLNLLHQMIEKLIQKKPAYQCNHCGYELMSLYWLCPSCQKWDKIKPILEPEGL